jgi:hypothetical protein
LGCLPAAIMAIRVDGFTNRWYVLWRILHKNSPTVRLHTPTLRIERFCAYKHGIRSSEDSSGNAKPSWGDSWPVKDKDSGAQPSNNKWRNDSQSIEAAAKWSGSPIRKPQTATRVPSKKGIQSFPSERRR